MARSNCKYAVWLEEAPVFLQKSLSKDVLLFYLVDEIFFSFPFKKKKKMMREFDILRAYTVSIGLFQEKRKNY